MATAILTTGTRSTRGMTTRVLLRLGTTTVTPILRAMTTTLPGMAHHLVLIDELAAGASAALGGNRLALLS